MDPTHLHQIAVEAMRSRGLLPVFSPQALQEAEAARQTGPERNGGIHDLRHLLDSRLTTATRGVRRQNVTEPL